jgi:hypothetical protein
MTSVQPAISACPNPNTRIPIVISSSAFPAVFHRTDGASGRHAASAAIALQHMDMAWQADDLDEIFGRARMRPSDGLQHAKPSQAARTVDARQIHPLGDDSP